MDSASLGERRRDQSSPRDVGDAGVSSGRETLSSTQARQKPVLAVSALLVSSGGENTFVYAGAVLVVVLRRRRLR